MNLKKEKKTIKTYADKVKLELDGFEIQHLMNLLEEEAVEAKDILNIQIAVRLYEKLKEVFKENWKN